MKIRTLSKILAVVAIFAMVLSFASCKGKLTLESFTVDTSTVKTNYAIGEAIDFSGIKATAKYSDASLNKVYTYNELTITYDKDITATEGTKYVTVSFDDPHLNEKQETKVEIKVSAVGGEGDNYEPQILAGFEKPAFITNFNEANKSDNKLAYGDAGFQGEFLVGDKTYAIGNENNFKFMPVLSVLDGRLATELDKFYADVTISVYKDGAYVALTAVEGEGNLVEYFDGETLMATVDTYEGAYKFSANAAGTKVKISVLPSSERYIADGDVVAVELEAKIVNAYNVYKAWELSVIHNKNDVFDEIKSQHGIAGVVASGVVLHNDIEITADDVPASYFYTTEAEVVYTNSVTGETVTLPVGTKYLKEWTYIYERTGAIDFVLEGNFFAIDVRNFPLVASPGVFGKDAGKDYGSDFSNASIFRFETSAEYTPNSTPADVANVTFNNLQVLGNTGRDNLVDSTTNLASAGGLIFAKSSHNTVMTLDNVIGNSFFITYFVDFGATMNVKNAKCYDSYQNAAFAYGDINLSFDNSYLIGCGGPVIIAQSEVSLGVHPVTNVTNSVVNTTVTGQEIWFTAVGATAIMPSIDTLSTTLKDVVGLGSLKKDGKMNIMATLMANGSGLTDVINPAAQGSIFVNGSGIERFDTNTDWQTMKAITGNDLSDLTKIPPFLTVTGSDGVAYTIWTDGANFYDLSFNALGTVPAHQALMVAFTTADTITLTQGGLSVVFEFYH